MKQTLEKLIKYCTKCTANCNGCIFVIGGECFFNDAPGDWDTDVLMGLLGKISETAESFQLPTTGNKRFEDSPKCSRCNDTGVLQEPNPYAGEACVFCSEK